MAKDNFIFYREWWDAIRELAPTEQLQVYESIMQYAFNGIEPTDKFIRATTSVMRSMIKHNLDKYERVCERNRNNGAKGGRPRKVENPKNPKNPVGFKTPEQPSESESESLTSIEQQFDDFRKAYPGSKRGFKAEFDNFKRKNKNTWREIVPLLMPALNRLKTWREHATAAGQFVPNYKNLATWLNQQCWTEELPEIINAKHNINHSQTTMPDYDSDDDFGGVKY